MYWSVPASKIRFILFLLFCLVLLPGLCSADENKVVTLKGKTMGTTYSILYRPESLEISSEDVQTKIDQRLESINQIMSTYIPDSEVSRFNQSRSTDWQPASAELVYIISEAEKISYLSDGAFDITVGPLVNLWNFGPDHHDHVPTDEEIQKAMESVGYQYLKLRNNPLSIKKTKPEVYIDLSAIAKGYAVDRVADLLMEFKIRHYLIEIGGEIRTKGGKEKDGFWTVAIEKPVPNSGSQIRELLRFKNESIATSGNYRNFHVIDGKTYSHTINPKTGRPVNHKTVSVSVLGPWCMDCDGWATALSVLPPEKSMEFARIHNMKVCLVEQQDSEFITSATSSYLKHIKLTPESINAQKGGNRQNLAVLVLAGVVISLAILGMAVGVIFSNRRIKGSCGGLAQFESKDGQSACDLCSTPPEECENKKALQEKES